MAAGGGGGRGGLGWVILAAALAVPGFLFYNWWSHLKAEHDHAISAKASKRADGGVFQTAPPTGRLVNPMVASTAAAAGLPSARTAPAAGGAAPGSAASGAAAPAGTASAATMPVSTTPAGAASASTTPAGAIPAGMQPPPTAAASISTAATIVLSRDPMMSPLDAVRLQEAALAEEQRLRDLELANRPHKERKKTVVLVPIEKHIELQGIVAKADGDNLAIINGATVNPGESFTVERYPGKVRVVKITSSEVTLDYKGRKIKLNVNAE